MVFFNICVKMKNVITFFFAFIIGSVYSQQSINASAGNATGAGGSANYSVGQMTFSNYTSLGGVITEGVQQPFEIFILSNENFENFNNVILYPNPTSSQLFLSFMEANDEFEYALMDINGKILLQKKTLQLNAIVNIENFPAGLYFLTLSSVNNSKSKSYKIIKK